MEKNNYNKKKSSNQNRFENTRSNYSDRDILMETLYNSRLTREASLKNAKNIKTLVFTTLVGGIAFLIALLILIKKL